MVAILRVVVIGWLLSSHCAAEVPNVDPNASRKLLELLRQTKEREIPSRDQIQQMKRFAEEHPQTTASLAAELYRSSLMVTEEEGDLEGAEKIWERLIADFPHTWLAVAAHFNQVGLAHLYGNDNKVIELGEKALDERNISLLRKCKDPLLNEFLAFNQSSVDRGTDLVRVMVIGSYMRVGKASEARRMAEKLITDEGKNMGKAALSAD